MQDQTKKATFVRDLLPGMLFGEVALLFGTKRTATVKSKDQCTVGALSEENFNEMLNYFPEVENMLKMGARQYVDGWKMYQIRAMEKVDYL